MYLNRTRIIRRSNPGNPYRRSRSLYKRSKPGRVTGHGAYKFRRATYSRKPAEALGSFAGGALGTYLGGPAGGAAGSMIGKGVGGLAADAVKTLTGHGDYNLRTRRLTPGGMPVFKNFSLDAGAIRVQHTEYIADVYSNSVSAGLLAIYPFMIQPANTVTFPWLSQVAANFQEWKLNGMVFQFRSTCSNAIASSTNLALGTIIMAVDYNPNNATPSSKAQLMDLQGARSFKVAESCLFPVETARRQTPLINLYTNYGSNTQPILTNGVDERFSDFGRLYISSQGLQGTGINLGELHVSYDITLYKPKLFTTTGSAINSAVASATTGITGVSPYGTDLTWSSSSTFSVGVSGTSFIFPSSGAVDSQYVVALYWLGTNAAIDPPEITASNCTAEVFAALPTVTNDRAGLLYVVQIPAGAVDPFVSLSADGVYPASASLHVVVTQLPNQLNVPIF